MGMDLKPINPSPDAPSDDRGVRWGRYNWSGWDWLQTWLREKGVDTSEFTGFNDGAPISDATCKTVAAVIEKHIDELDVEEQEWLRPHIQRWRTCGGYEQY